MDTYLFMKVFFWKTRPPGVPNRKPLSHRPKFPRFPLFTISSLVEATNDAFGVHVQDVATYDFTSRRESQGEDKRVGRSLWCFGFFVTAVEWGSLRVWFLKLYEWEQNLYIIYGVTNSLIEKQNRTCLSLPHSRWVFSWLGFAITQLILGQPDHRRQSMLLSCRFYA